MIAGMDVMVRRGPMLALALTAFALALPGLAAAADHAAPAISPEKALEQLEAGNVRFVAHTPQHPNQGADRVRELAAGQHPIAVVLSCSDSRVPPELVFDQGLGDIFSIRVAGNIASGDGIGSIEYAVEHLGVPLIVVMGHEKCGAVSAAMSGGEPGNHIQQVVDAIAPVVPEAKKDAKDPLDAAVRLNVKKVVGELEHSDPVLSKAVAEGKLQVVGAYYSLDSGAVTMLTGAPAHAGAAKP